MHCQLVNNVYGQYFVMVRQHHWLSGIPHQRPETIGDEWNAGIFIRQLDVDAHQWRRWVDHSYVDLRYGESAFTTAAIRELARGQFNIYPIRQEEFLRCIPKACTFQNNQDPDSEHHEYAIIPSVVALVKPGYDAVPMLVARRLLQAWAVTADVEQLRQMLTLLQLRYGKSDSMEVLLAALVEGLSSGVVCLVRFRRRVTQARSKTPEFLPFVHQAVPLGPPEIASASAPKKNSEIKDNIHPILESQDSNFASTNASGHTGSAPTVEWIKPSERTEQYNSAVVEVTESELRLDFDADGDQITRRGVYREEYKSLMGAGNLVEKLIVGRGRRIFPLDFAVKVRTTGEQIKYVRYERSVKILVKDSDGQEVGDTEILKYGDWRKTADVQWINTNQLKIAYPVKLSACLMACFTDVMK